MSNVFARPRGWARPVLGLTISAVCMWLALRKLWFNSSLQDDAWEAFHRADYRTLPALAAATLLFYWLKAWRWRLMLHPVGDFDVNRVLFPLTMIGYAFNNLLPAQLGVVVRVGLFVRHMQVRTAPVIATVVLERIFDAIAVLSLLAVELLLLPEIDPAIGRNVLILSAVVGVTSLAIMMYVGWPQACLRRTQRLLSLALRPAQVAAAVRLLETSGRGMLAIRQTRLLAGIVGLSYASWLVNAAVVYLSLVSFGVPASPLLACVVSAVTAVGIALPAAPGSIGVIQFCFVAVVSLTVRDDASVLGASVYYHVVEYATVTLMGLWYFQRMRWPLSTPDGHSSPA